MKNANLPKTNAKNVRYSYITCAPYTWLYVLRMVIGRATIIMNVERLVNDHKVQRTTDITFKLNIRNVGLGLGR